MQKLYTKATLTRSSKQDSDFVAVASTQVVDRHGEIVSVDGWDTKSYKDNPILLWAHQHDEIGIGQAKKFWVEGEGKKSKFMIEGFIHDKTEKARALKELVKEGIIKTVSVGFRPIEMEGDTYVKQELLEVSLVNVPANQQALISAYKSLESKGFKEEVINELGIPTAVLDKLETMDKDIKELQTELQAVVKAQSSAAPPSKVLRERQSMSKIIARASDKLLEAEKKSLPKNQKRDLIKVIKRANENLSKSHKGEMNNG